MIIMPEAFNDAMSINLTRNRYIDNYPTVMSTIIKPYPL